MSNRLFSKQRMIEWSCEVCTFVNSVKAKKCGVCEMEREPKTPYSSNAQRRFLSEQAKIAKEARSCKTIATSKKSNSSISSLKSFASKLSKNSPNKSADFTGKIKPLVAMDDTYSDTDDTYCDAEDTYSDTDEYRDFIKPKSSKPSKTSKSPGPSKSSKKKITNNKFLPSVKLSKSNNKSAGLSGKIKKNLDDTDEDILIPGPSLKSKRIRKSYTFDQWYPNDSQTSGLLKPSAPSKPSASSKLLALSKPGKLPKEKNFPRDYPVFPDISYENKIPTVVPITANRVKVKFYEYEYTKEEKKKVAQYYKDVKAYHQRHKIKEKLL